MSSHTRIGIPFLGEFSIGRPWTLSGELCFKSTRKAAQVSRTALLTRYSSCKLNQFYQNNVKTRFRTKHCSCTNSCGNFVEIRTILLHLDPFRRPLAFLLSLCTMFENVTLLLSPLVQQSSAIQPTCNRFTWGKLKQSEHHTSILQIAHNLLTAWCIRFAWMLELPLWTISMLSDSHTRASFHSFPIKCHSQTEVLLLPQSVIIIIYSQPT